jgi:hypothetical protein
MVYPTFARVSLVAFPTRVSLEHCAESAQTSGAHRQTFGNFSVYAQHPLEGFSIFEDGWGASKSEAYDGSTRGIVGFEQRFNK